MRKSDAFVLPSIEEGLRSPAEAIGSGCVPLVSDACGEACTHRETGSSTASATSTLCRPLTALHEDRELLERLQAGCLRAAAQFTWERAGQRLLGVYREVVGEASRHEDDPAAVAA